MKIRSLGLVDAAGVAEVLQPHVDRLRQQELPSMMGSISHVAFCELLSPEDVDLLAAKLKQGFTDGRDDRVGFVVLELLHPDRDPGYTAQALALKP